MARDSDEFEGIDISGPWGGLRIGSGRGEPGDGGDPEVRAVRRRVRQKLDLYRNITWFVIVVGGLALLDWSTGGGWWVQWVAGIWGAFLVVQALSAFRVPTLWGREAEDRMVQQEMERRRGRVEVRHAPPDDVPPPH